VIVAVTGAPPESALDADRRTVVGVVCEPYGEPAGMAERLAADLRERLAGMGGGAWDVRVHHARLPLTEDTRNVELLKHLGRLGRSNDWDLTVCLVDVPMRADGRAIVADAHLAAGTALLSLPAGQPAARRGSICGCWRREGVGACWSAWSGPIGRGAWCSV
jgi:hypothetical protein